MAEIFDLYYGEPGSAKTRAIIELAKQKVTSQGKDLRCYIGDGSAQMYRLAVEKGDLPKERVHIVEFTLRDEPFTTMQMLCEGFFPSEESDSRSKLRKLTPEEVKNTGMWVFEGMAVTGNYMMGDMKGGLAQRAADGDIIGQDINVRITDSDSKYNFGGSSGAHYNLTQRHLLQDILRTKALPGIVIWTSHERYDDGERGGSFAKGSGGEKYKLTEKTIGPEGPGKQMTASISREFGNTLHFTLASKKIQEGGNDEATGKGKYVEKQEYRIYTRDHYDPDGIVPMKYRAICRTMNPSKISDYYTSKVPGQGLLDFYAALRS